ncbi:MAG: hypothetical protein CBD16_01135 [Betaproteobacteria bacterium TMED156]|nr:MAG: hypothetical protein CBD16_01135 [Betaproteobacteria bacterium TMED156]
MDDEYLQKTLNARLYGEPINNLPRDLYIPPDALEIILEVFEGPLDLLIYLIKKENFNILDIPMAKVTTQYLEYVEKIRTVNLELASEYLLMAAVLIEIKARMLVPKKINSTDEEESNDPRADLVRQLIEYEKFKKVAKQVDGIPRVGREFSTPYVLHYKSSNNVLPSLTVIDLHNSIKSLLTLKSLRISHSITKELFSVREHMSMILNRISDFSYIEFIKLFQSKKSVSRMSIVVHFVALLELSKSGLVKITQTKFDSAIWIGNSEKNEESKTD